MHVLQGQHERSVEWFRRALRLCRTYLSAWTLMGHEFVEMKNAPAAIGECPSGVAQVEGLVLYRDRPLCH
jgi:hypothetical protein